MKTPFSPVRPNLVGRMFIREPWHGRCKRCLGRGKEMQPGDIIATVFDKEAWWWHDACYRLIDPSFYEGLNESDPIGELADVLVARNS